MTDSPKPSAPTGGNAVTPDPGVAAEGAAALEPAAEAEATAGSTRRRAISLIKEHPLGAVATVAAATALLELQFAVGVLAGLGATALLANKSGPERRRIVLEHSKWALVRARAMKAALKKGAALVQQAPPVSPV